MALPALEKQLCLMLDSGAPYAPVVTDGAVALLRRDVMASCSPALASLLRALSHCWDGRGRPVELTTLGPLGLTGRQSGMLKCLLNAAEEAMATGVPVWGRPEDIRALDPDIFVRTLGWRNLRRWTSPALLQFAERRAEGRPPAELWPLIRFLSGCRDEWHFSHLVLAAAVMTGEQVDGAERHSPVSLRNCIRHLAAFFRVSDLGLGYSSAQLDLAIPKMLRDPPPSIRMSSLAAYIDDYRRCTDAQLRWVTEKPVELRTLSCHLLAEPAWTDTVPARQAFRKARNEQKHRRDAQVRALLPYVKPLGHQVLGRAVAFRAIGAAYLETLRRAGEQGVRDGVVPFEVTLPDGSATLRFALRKVWSMEPERLTGSNRWSRFSDHWLTEYLGAEDPSGVPLPLPFFAVLHRTWYDREASAPLIASGVPSTDFQPQTSGLLRPAGLFGACVTSLITATVRHEGPHRFLFDMHALCTGMSMGALLVMLCINTGLRIHELQQIRLDPGYIGQFPTEEGQMADFWVRVSPKGRKRAKFSSMECLIDGMHQPLWRETLAWLNRTGGLSDRAVLEHGTAHAMEAGRYLFQFGGRGLSQVKLITLIRAVCFGLDDAVVDGKTVSLIPHLFRHINVRIRDELQHDPGKISRDLGHASPSSTERYRGPRHERGQSGILGTIRIQTLWQCLLPEIHSVQSISGQGER